jgi:hypothetical protein
MTNFTEEQLVQTIVRVIKENSKRFAAAARSRKTKRSAKPRARSVAKSQKIKSPRRRAKG